MWSHATCLSAYAASLTECGISHAGCRQWDGFRRWITTNIDEALTAWFGRVEVVRDGKTEFSPQRRYMFGYAPHGLFPIGMHLSFCSRTSFLCQVFLRVVRHQVQTCTNTCHLHPDIHLHNTGVGYLPLMPAWRVALPGVDPVSSLEDRGKHRQSENLMNATCRCNQQCTDTRQPCTPACRSSSQPRLCSTCR